MYESFFEFEKRPFPATPEPDFYFAGAAIEHARKTLIRCTERAEGPALVVGPAGTGKTLLCRVVAEHFKDEFKVAMLTCGRLCSRRALLQAILFEFGLPYRGMDEGELRLSLIDHLEPGGSCPNGMLLIVDEAHTLPLRLLEELRLISNLVRDGQSRVRLLLCGNPILEERFASPKLASFSQRLATRCYLESLGKGETVEYIRSGISAVGGDGRKILGEEACGAVYDATDGIPRLVNQLCDHALMMAALGAREEIDAAGVHEAWADLQQLPAPAGEPDAAAGGDDAIIEFGDLDDEAGEAPSSVPFRPAKAAADHDAMGTVAEQRPTAGAMIDPDVQLERIEQKVAEAGEEIPADSAAADEAGVEEDEPFRPVGTIGPEVELAFPAAKDPFGEKFDREEVVVDRYASLETEASGRFPRVSSDEGREIAAALIEPAATQKPPTPQPPQPTSQKSSGGDEPEQPSGRAEELQAIHFPPAPARAIDPAADPVMPESDAPAASGMLSAEAAAPSMPAHDDTEVEIDFIPPDDRDLIVVEPRPAEPATQPRRRAARAYRQEYGQLFAKLRQG